MGLKIFSPMRRLILTLGYRYTGESYLISDLSNAFEKLDDYYSIDTKISYDWKHVRVFFGVNNITNEKYSEYAVIGRTPVVRTFYPSAERNWIAGLEINL